MYLSFAVVRIDVEGDKHVNHDDRYVTLQLSDDEIRKLNNLEFVFESLFFIDMVTNFFKEY